MKNSKKISFLIYLSLVIFIISCNSEKYQVDAFPNSLPSNTLNYTGSPISVEDKSSLMFSDQGAWFAYGFPSEGNIVLGFSGPFLMTQGQGGVVQQNVESIRNYKYEISKSD